MLHELKTWPEFHEPIWLGKKSFDIRFNDRNFQVGDILVLREWDPELGDYTGRSITVDVTYILHGPQFGVEDGCVIMSIKPR
jgi:hypothetical protein